MAPAEVVTVPIPIPITVPCMDNPPERPAWQLDKPDKQSDVMLLRQALHDALTAKGYAAELEAILAACD